MPREHHARPRRSRVDWWLVAFVVLGFGLRLATIDTRGLWLDEALTARQASESVPNIIATTVGGVHPPFFHILMHYWVSYFGVGEVALRGFALVFGVAAIPAAYWAGRRMFSRRVARIAAGVVAFWPYHIWYSQEARMYSMLMFFGLLSVSCLYLALEKNTLGRWAAFWLFTTMGAFVHYYFFFLIFGEVLYYVVEEVIVREKALRRRGERQASLRRPWGLFADVDTLAPWLIVNTLLAASIGSWVGYAVFWPSSGGSALLSSVSAAGLGYGQVGPSFAVRFNDVGMMVVEAVLGFHPPAAMSAFVAMWPLAIYVLLLLFDLIGPTRRPARLLIWSASGIPFVWALGQWQGQVLASRYFMPLLAPVLLLVAATLAWMPDRARRVVLVVGLILALAAYGDQSFNPDNAMRYDNRRAIGYVAAHQQPGDTIIYEPFYTDALFQYYLPKNLTAYGFPQYGQNGVVRGGKALIGQDLQRVTEGSKRVWLVLSYQNIPELRGDAYNTEMWFLRHGYHTGENLPMNQVWVIRYDLTTPPPSPATTTTAPPAGETTPAVGGQR